MLGIGGGGAALLDDSHTAFFETTSIQNNTARGAGAIFVMSHASLILNCTILSQNTGESFAGAIATSGGVRLSVFNSIIENNIASRVRSVLAFNDDNTAIYTIVGSIFIDKFVDKRTLHANFLLMLW